MDFVVSFVHAIRTVVWFLELRNLVAATKIKIVVAGVKRRNFNSLFSFSPSVRCLVVFVRVLLIYMNENENVWMRVRVWDFELILCFALLVYCSTDSVSWPQQNNLFCGRWISWEWILSQTYSNKTWLTWNVWNIQWFFFSFVNFLWNKKKGKEISRVVYMRKWFCK